MIGQLSVLKVRLDIDSLLNRHQGITLQFGSRRQFPERSRHRHNIYLLCICLHLPGCGLSVIPQIFRQSPDIPASVQLRDPHGVAGLIFYFIDDLHGIQRITSIQEIITFQIEILPFQHCPEDPQQFFLQPGTDLSGLPCGNRPWKRGLIHLSIGSKRYLVQPDDHRGKHIARQIRSGISQQFSFRQHLPRGIISSQNLLAPVCKYFDRRLFHFGMGRQASGDLLGFQPHAPKLKLPVRSSSENDLALRRPSGGIPGPVYAVPQYKGIIKKAFLCHLLFIAISSAHARAADIEISIDPNGQRIHPVIQHIEPAVLHRRARSDLRRMIQQLHAYAHGSF